MVASVLAGYNGTIIAYGQTGSGKSHTLLGCISSAAERGIVPRAVAELGRGIAAYPEPCTFRVGLLSAWMKKLEQLHLPCMGGGCCIVRLHCRVNPGPPARRPAQPRR